jgi:pilus assembly protein CpaC
VTRPIVSWLLLTAALCAPIGATAQGDPSGRSAPALVASAVSSPAYPAAGRQGVYGYSGLPQGGTVRVDLSGDQTESRSMTLPRGKSAVIELPRDAQDVVVSDPKVADVVLSTRRRIFVLGVGGGQTDASFYDASGRPILRLNIRVDQDIAAFGETLNRILPGSRVQVEAVNQSIVLSGEVPSQAAADKAVRLAQGFVTKPDQVVNMLSITESEQVMLKVRIVEVNRQVIKQLGFNLSALIGQVGNAQFLLQQAATWGVNGSLLGGISGGYNLNTTSQPELQVPCASGVSSTCYQIIKPNGNNTYTTTNPLLNQAGTQVIGANGVPETYNTTTNIANPGTATAQTTVGSNGVNKAGASVDAFEQVGLVRTLAEPNLTAVSGESAKFLVGGEFPVPTGEDNTGRVTVEFKQYGVGLGFSPVVLSKGRISLKLSTEVSEITNTGSFTLTSTTTSNGLSTQTPLLTVPGLNVRRAETTVELPSGQSMMIAGLLQSVNQQTLASLPGLMQVPILGTLFRSRDYQQGETELVIIVTPYLVKPTGPGQLQTPADGLRMANDLEVNLLGKLNHVVAKTDPPPGKTYQGPFGYVVE